jgi:heme exporter protein C
MLILITGLLVIVFVEFPEPFTPALPPADVLLEVPPFAVFVFVFVFLTLGCVTGSSWASITWESWWPSDDPKLNGVAIGMFMYLAYLILRTSLKDPYQRARISSVYAILIYPIFMALIAIMPKLSADTLHPGSGGTVGFNKYDLDNTLRLFFYPAVIGWILFFIWISILRYRFETLKNIQIEREDNE